MIEIEHYMDKVSSLSAELEEAYAQRDRVRAERDALQAAMDLAAVFGPIHSPVTWVQSVEHLTAERDALQALVNDLAANVGRAGYPPDLRARLVAAAVTP